MTTSLKNKKQDTNPEGTLDYLASISNKTPQEIKELFEKFQIDEGFPAHRNLITEILSICRHKYNERIFASLEIYQNLVGEFEAYSEADLYPVAPQGKWGNPVKFVSKRPIAALVLMAKSRKNAQYEPIYVLSQLIIFATFSDLKKSPTNQKHITKAANAVRSLVESDQPISLLSEFGKRLENIFYINELFELITHNQAIRSNPKAISIFSAISQILPLIPTKGKAHFRVSRPSSLHEPSDVTNIMFRPPSVFFPETPSSDEPEEECLVYTSDLTDEIHTIDEEEIHSELADNFSSSELEQLSSDLKETQQQAQRFQLTSQPIVYLDNDFSQYSRNLHNPIERQWLSSALQEPEYFDSDNITALCIGLSICTSINYAELLDQSISENGLITPDGYIRRQIPDIPNAINPEKKTRDLYQEHINDQDKPYVYLPLPAFIKNQICSIPEKHLRGAQSIRDLFNSNKEEPEDKIKGFINKLNKQYGQRFNTNRISCQLKQYIKSAENDLCLTYALFGRPEQKAPTAFYYRSITLGKLISIFETLSKQYFHEK